MLQHTFCCFLPILGAVLGAAIPGVHNPFLELGLALGGAVLGVQVDKLLHKKKMHDCACHESDADIVNVSQENHARFKGLVKAYGLPLIFALGVWAIHLVAVHGNHGHGLLEGHKNSINFAPYLNGASVEYSQDVVLPSLRHQHTH
tara:strand:+ start:1092 stop:1529 length:438 start_codon:yes stop_codon:yes gene_type:complete